MKKVDGIYPDGTKHRDNSILLPVFFPPDPLHCGTVSES